MWLRGLLFLLFLSVLVIGTLLLVPRTWLLRPVQDLAYQYLGEESYQEPPPSRQINPVSVEPFCLDRHADWRESQTLEGIAIAASPVCEPDNPAEIAAFVKGTNNISLHTLMETRLTPNTVVKENDRDGDGDPDEIHVRLEVVELNGHSPDDPAPFPAYAIAPGVQPGLWVFAPKSRGMATENFESEWAHPTLRAPSPVIRVEQGDTLRVTLENAHYLPHTIHFHGVDHPFVDATGEGNDGVPIASEMPVSPGESRTYEMTPRQTGTMFYHCHVQPHVHILMGLQGMFVVEDNRPNNWLQTLNIGAGRVRAVSAAVSESYDREFDLHYQDIDPALNNIIQTAGDPRLIAEATNRRYDITDQEPDYFLLNGRSFPYTTRESLVVVAPNERVKLRVLNGGAEGISLHTHGHKVRITHYDGVEHNPVAQITRDVVWISPAQRVDLLLNTTDDGRHNYGPGVWLLHDHKEKAITTDGINPGGNISAIVYQDYLDTSGQPKTQGMDWAPFFTQEYYQKKLPVWAGLEDFGLLGEAGARSLPLSYALILGIGIGLLIGAAFALRKRGARSVLMGCIVLTSLSGGVGSAQEHESHHHHAHHGMQLDTAGMVMNENTDQLPRGCPRLSGEHDITVRAGKEFARPGTMFAYDRNEWNFAPCTKLTVTLINTDTVRHQWMLHGLPRYIYPMGMFTLEVAGKGQRTGTFILPPGDKTYLVHCDVSQHMEKGMKAQLKVGAGDGDLPSIPGVTGPRRRDPYVLVWNGWTHGAVVLFGLVGALFVGRKLRLSP